VVLKQLAEVEINEQNKNKMWTHLKVLLSDCLWSIAVCLLNVCSIWYNVIETSSTCLLILINLLFCLNDYGLAMHLSKE